MRSALLIVALAGCAKEAPDGAGPTETPTESPSDTGTTSTTRPPSVVIVDPPPPRVTADREVLLEGAVEAAVPLDLETLLTAVDGELVALDPFGARTSWGPIPGRLVDAAWWEGTPLLSVEGALTGHDGVQLVASPLAEIVGPATRLVGWGADLWIGGEAGLMRVRGGSVVGVTVDGDALGPFALGGVVRGSSVVWAGQGAELHGVGNAGAVWVDLSATELLAEVDSVAVDASGASWATAGGWLHQRVDDSSRWQRLDLGLPVWAVHGHPDAEGVWVEADEGRWFRVAGGAWEEVEGLPAASPTRPPEVDAAGRLVVAAAGQVVRGSTHRPLVVLGLDPGGVVARPTPVSLLPTAADAVTALEAELVGASATLPLPVVDGVAVLDPEGLAPGPWTFRGIAHYGDGPRTAEVPLFLGADFEPTWAVDIEPLYLDHCATCHGGAAATVLETPEDWEVHIEAILANVRVGNMPLGGSPLSDLEVVVIEAWRDAGFPR